VEPKSIAKSNRNFLRGEEARAWMVEEVNLLSTGLGAEAGVTMHDGAAVAKDLCSRLSRDKWRDLVKSRLFVK